jgi:hypothetical protein
MTEQQRENKSNLQMLMKLAALIAFMMFLYHAIAPVLGLSALSENAIYWYILALVAIIFPSINEITFKDIHVLLKDMNESKKALVMATTQLEEARLRFDKTRKELVLGYLEYLKGLPEKERTEKKINLTRLYLEGMMLSEKDLTEKLADLPGVDFSVTETLTADTMAAIERFQRMNGLIPDGIFGYQTYGKLLEISSDS